jgi:hypothetical protein
VDLIYLYDNEDVPTYHRLFQCNPRVKVTHFPNGGCQCQCATPRADVLQPYYGWHKLPVLPRPALHGTPTPPIAATSHHGALCVTFTVAARKGVQVLAQLDWIKNYKDKHTWAMLPNADEFIVLKKVSCVRVCAPARLLVLISTCAPW